MKKALVLIACIATLASCAIQPQVFTPLLFDQAEYDALPKTGTGVVKGQVFAKTVGGEVRKGAGNTVHLIPVTKYREQWYSEALMQGKKPVVDADKRYLKFDREKTTDGEGRFEFNAIPPGKYYVLSSVSWETTSTNEYSRRLGLMDKQGGMVVRTVYVTNGATAEAMLAR